MSRLDPFAPSVCEFWYEKRTLRCISQSNIIGRLKVGNWYRRWSHEDLKNTLFITFFLLTLLHPSFAAALERPQRVLEACECQFPEEISAKSVSAPDYIIAPLPGRIFKIASNYRAVNGYVVNDNGNDVFVMELKHNYIIGQIAWAIYGSYYEENYIKLKLKRFIVLNMENKKPEIIYVDNSI